MTPLYIDLETRSPVDLKKSGLARYSRDPRTEVLCMAYAFGEEEIRLWVPGELLEQRVQAHVGEGRIVVAHNAQFEISLWDAILASCFKWPRLRPGQVRCTMAACYAQSLPGALENAAHALGLKISKDTEGRALMLRMCKPQADGTYYDPPGARARLGEYCKTDVAVEREIYKRVMALSPKEQKLWELDQAINLRGVPFDMPSIKAALEVADTEKERLNVELGKATGGAVTACSALPALKDWAADYGVMPDSLAKAELIELLDEENLPAPVKTALKIRQDAGRFTSISKLNAITNREIDGRVPYTLQYHAATTGRWAGRGLQPHNFPRDLPEPAEVEEIFRLLREKDLRWLDMLYGQPSIMISKCLRGFIKAAKGNQLMGGDFAQIEGRGIAWLAGEEWEVEAFRAYDNGTGPDLYLLGASKILNISIESVTKDQRQAYGKVPSLAMAYAGGVGAFQQMAKTYGVKVSDAQAEEIKLAWRAAHPRIKSYWYELQEQAIRAVREPGVITEAGAFGRKVLFRKRGSFLWCRLPSGRNLCYPYIMIQENGKFGNPALTFKTVPDTAVWSTFIGQKERGETNTTYVVDEPTNTREWCRISTYSGKLAENITQAICRDILADAMLRVEEAGFQICLTVHDEIIVEGIYTEQDRVKFEKLMNVRPIWAKDFPINASCWLADRYRKG